MAISATQRGLLVYDFYGFPQHYYEMTYGAPGAPELASKVKKLMPATEPVLDRETRGLDHGAWVPLKAMYPDADVPVLQLSMPDLDPQRLFEVGRRLAPLRDEGVLIVGSGFLTHGLPYVHEYFLGKPGAPQWSIDFDQWATEALNRGDLDTLFAFREKAPSMPYAHPTVEHFAPLLWRSGRSRSRTTSPSSRSRASSTASRSAPSRRADHRHEEQFAGGAEGRRGLSARRLQYRARGDRPPAAGRTCRLAGDGPAGRRPRRDRRAAAQARIPPSSSMPPIRSTPE